MVIQRIPGQIAGNTAEKVQYRMYFLYQQLQMHKALI